ncbi:complement C1q-like protein 3 [Silurus meridionalis]|uniref:C1q domain-containing protein n=1 Tax=Silurus meridionalis TaxID=175797 RepID=A0A8T0ACE9_SILME|nr:complement C1q-like protein 3 [Silurus meridionalis]KAF7688941.1 hypothetical protein HF521_013748 [Silurus meridionalis]KAI5089573.1 hypothetical protein C0J45_20981 [Silurus meridionalis]
MKAAVIFTLVSALVHSSLQDAETPASKLDPFMEYINMRDQLIEMSMEMRIMQMDNKDMEALMGEIELELKNQKAIRNIAFSAALSNSVGQYNEDVTLVYSKVITNTGQAYNPVTGIFTAPLNGIYYIRFTSCGNTGRHGMAVDLYKNNEKMSGLVKESDGYMTYFSGGLILQLEVGDTVYTKLPANTKLYDDVNNRTTFSGFVVSLT